MSAERVPLWRDPLVVFAALFAFVLSLELLRGSEEAPGDTPSHPVIEIGVAQEQAFALQLEQRLGRTPTNAEVEAMLSEWIDTEVLVREARALQLDANDAVLRAHLARKMREVLADREVPEEPTDADLEALLASEPERWTIEETLTLRQLFFVGDDAMERAQSVFAELESGSDFRRLEAWADEPPGGPVWRGRRVERLRELLGDEATEALLTHPSDVWRMLRSELGVHLVRIEERVPGRALSLADARERLRLHWQRQQIEEASALGLQELRARYEVRRPAETTEVR